MTIYRDLGHFAVISRREFEARFGPLPATFPGDVMAVTLDSRPDMHPRDMLSITGKPMLQCRRAEGVLDLTVRRQVLDGLAREERWLELVVRPDGRKVRQPGRPGSGHVRCAPGSLSSPGRRPRVRRATCRGMRSWSGVAYERGCAVAGLSA